MALSGSGTQGDPYLVGTPSDLDEVRDDLTAWYRQTADIDMDVAPFNTSSFLSIGQAADGSGNTAFTGHYDGDGHVIQNLWIDYTVTGENNFHNGLFSAITTGSVRRLGLVNVDIYGGRRCGGIAGGMITSADGRIEECYVTGTVGSSRHEVGGICGYLDFAQIRDCWTDAFVQSDGSVFDGGQVGGVVGHVETATAILERCYALGTARLINGAQGGNFAAEAVVSRVDDVGPTPDNTWDTDTSANATDGGDPAATPRTTAQMQTGTPFTNWNVAAWVFEAGQYPRLSWQPAPSTDRTGTGTGTLPALIGVGSNLESISGTGTGTLPALTGTGAGSQTTMRTVTVGPDVGVYDYTSLEDAELAERFDRTVAQEGIRFLCHPMIDTFSSFVTFHESNWGNSKEYPIVIEGVEPLDGTWAQGDETPATCYRAARSGGVVFFIKTQGLIFRNIQVRATRGGSGGTFAAFQSDSGDTFPVSVELDKMVVKVEPESTYGMLRISGTTGYPADVKIRNLVCLVADPTGTWNSGSVISTGRWGVSGSTPGKVDIQNVTILNEISGVDRMMLSYSGNDGRIQNVIVQNAGTGADFDISGDGTKVVSHNLSSDATATGTGSVTNTTLDLQDATALDARLASTDTQAIDAGVDLSGADYPVTEDIAGTARPQGVSFDMGFHEFVSVVSPLTQTRYRWRNDDGDETTATWAAAEDTGITLPAGERKRLRTQIQTEGDQGSVEVELRVRKQGSGDDYEAVI